jgi:hypothetical protein
MALRYHRPFFSRGNQAAGTFIVPTVTVVTDLTTVYRRQYSDEMQLVPSLRRTPRRRIAESFAGNAVAGRIAGLDDFGRANG